MCGISGIFGTQKIKLEKSLEKLCHRGPDSQKIFTGHRWKIAFARLAIFDLSPNGMQPFKNEVCTIFYNGEIYNYKELAFLYKNEFSPQTKSDGEILPFLYKKFGIEFLNQINGMFSMVIIDETTNTKFLIRDRFAKKPFYFIKKENNVFFSSEIKALKEITDCIPCPESTLMNLFFWGLPPPFSNFKNVNSIPPGSFVKILPDNSLKLEKWYCGLDKLVPREFKETEFSELFNSSLKLRYAADVPVGILLSGGLDSMLITETLRQQGKDLTALTCDIPDKSKTDSFTDSENPNRYCKEFRLKKVTTQVDYEFWNHNILDIVKSFDEVFLDSGNLIFYALGKLARQNGIKVVLVGNGGDELFGGYPWQSRFHMIHGFLQESSKIREGLLRSFEWISSQIPPSVFLRRILKTMRLVLAPVYAQMDIGGAFSYDILYKKRKPANEILHFSNQIKPYNKKKSGLDKGNLVNLVNIRQLVPQQNYKVDMGSMAYSVENRCPFLDYRIVEYMMGVAHLEKVKNGPKSLLRKFARSRLPHYILASKKSGPTMPTVFWFQKDRLSLAKMFIQKCRPLYGDFFGGWFADYWGNPKTDWGDTKNSLTLFALLSLGLWLQHNLQSNEFLGGSSFENHVLSH